MAASRQQIEALIAALEAQESQSPGHLAGFLGQQAYGNVHSSAVRRPDHNVFALMRENPERFAALIEQVRPGYFDRQHGEAPVGTGTINLQYAPQNALPPTSSQAASGLEMKLGDFILQKELGRGAMGVVYLAQDARLDRQVALKLLPALSGDDLLRFVQEGRSMGQLKPHPNIVQVYTAGSDQGKHYLAMELVDNARKLGDVLPSLPSETNRWLATARLLEQVIRGVAYAHQHKVIHRDLKPDNVLVAADGTPKVADFGLAKSTSKPGNLTQEGDIVGTPGYMAPEQFEGNRSLVGPHSDVYSLGAIIYEALTLRKPYHFTSMADIALELKELDRLPRKPTELVPNVPLELERIAMKALNKRVEKRYRNAGQLLTDISTYVTEQELSEAERERLDELRKAQAAATEAQQKRKRNTIIGGLGAAVLAAVGSLAVVSLNYRAQGAELTATRANDARNEAEAAQARAEATAAKAESDRQASELRAADAGRQAQIALRTEYISKMDTARLQNRRADSRRFYEAALALTPENERATLRNIEITFDIPRELGNVEFTLEQITADGIRQIYPSQGRQTTPGTTTAERFGNYIIEVTPQDEVEAPQPRGRPPVQVRRFAAYKQIIEFTGPTRITFAARPNIPQFFLIRGDDNVRDFYLSEFPIRCNEISQYARATQNQELEQRYAQFMQNEQLTGGHPAVGISPDEARAYTDWFNRNLRTRRGFERWTARTLTPEEADHAAAWQSGWTYITGNTFDAQKWRIVTPEERTRTPLGQLVVSCAENFSRLTYAPSRAQMGGNISELTIAPDGRAYIVGADCSISEPSAHAFRQNLRGGENGPALQRRDIATADHPRYSGFHLVLQPSE